jgi:hypothetical protein
MRDPEARYRRRGNAQALIEPASDFPGYAIDKPRTTLRQGDGRAGCRPCHRGPEPRKSPCSPGASMAGRSAGRSIADRREMRGWGASGSDVIPRFSEGLRPMGSDARSVRRGGFAAVRARPARGRAAVGRDRSPVRRRQSPARSARRRRPGSASRSLRNGCPRSGDRQRSFSAWIDTRCRKVPPITGPLGIAVGTLLNPFRPAGDERGIIGSIATRDCLIRERGCGISIGTRSRAEGDSRSPANKVRRHGSRSSRQRARGNPGGRVGVVGPTRASIGLPSRALWYPFTRGPFQDLLPISSRHVNVGGRSSSGGPHPTRPAATESHAGRTAIRPRNGRPQSPSRSLIPTVEPRRKSDSRGT